MKKLLFLMIVFFAFVAPCIAEEEETTLSGDGTILIRVVEGENQSSKFNEYRDIRDGLAGSVRLWFSKSDTYFLDFTAKNIGLDDQYFKLSMGKYGFLKIDATYDKIPHRFAFDARTLYTGIGTGDLILADPIQRDIQNSASSAEIASKLKDYYAGAFDFDSALFREKYGLRLNVTPLKQLSVNIDVSREERSGTRPIIGSFAFDLSTELMEPINYDTTDARFTVEYAKRPLYLSAGICFSDFKNSIDTLTWDNYLRIDDAEEDPSRGRIALYPDNTYKNAFLTAAFDFPMHGRVLARASWGQMEQNDRLIAYTINPTVVGEGDLNGDGTLELFNASDPANLPKSRVDAKVNPTFYDLLVTMKPAHFMNVKAHYRSYDYDNDTENITFPGDVEADLVWATEERINLHSSYKKSDAGLDLGFTFLRSNTITLGFARINMERSKNREVVDSNDDVASIAFDSYPVSWFEVRASYEKSKREGDYNFLAPFGPNEEQPPQLPWLRKYDEANRNRDRAQLLLNFYPTEKLTVSAQGIDGKDDFDDSPFGILEDNHRIYSLDIDYSLSEMASVYVFGTLEKYKNTERDRQWTQGGNGDPYITDTTYASASNWDATSEDRIRTYGAGLHISPAGQKNSFHALYSMSESEGKVLFSSPVGGPKDSNNFVPIEFPKVDNSELQVFNVYVKHHLSQAISLAIGFMNEKWNISDFEYDGFTYIPTTATGNLNSAILMGTLEPDYNVNIGYAKLYFRF